MSTLIEFLVVLAALLGTGIASALGKTPDTRDPRWSMGSMIEHRD